MKKSILMLLLACAFVLTASAQKKLDKGTKPYPYEFSIGPRAGIGISSLSQSEGLDVYDKSGLAYGGGLAANIRFSKKEDKNGRKYYGQGLFGIGLELNYKMYTAKLLEDNDDLKLGYFEVPILLQVYPFYAKKHLKNLYIEVGPTISGSVSSKPDFVKRGNLTYSTGDLKGFDVKPAVGIGYRFDKEMANDGFYANLRYYIGTSKLAGNFPAKVSSIELSVGYLFRMVGTKKTAKK